MASSPDEIDADLPLLSIRRYKSGRVERGVGTAVVPPSLSPTAAVHSKDVTINAVTNLSARIYLPNPPKPRLSLFIYFHGGGFCIESAFSPLYQSFCHSLATDVLIVSINYRLAPESPIPGPYEDSWEALKWVFSGKPDPWISDYADFDRVYLGGDSAGANIAHHMAIRVGSEGLPRLSGSGLAGVVLFHPYFWGNEAIKDETKEARVRGFMDLLWRFVYPDNPGSGCDHPYLNPNTDPNYSGLCCGRVLVCVAEKDFLRERGRDYYEKLGASEWKGEAEFFETKGEGHIFHLLNPGSENVKGLIERVGSFLNHESPKV